MDKKEVVRKKNIVILLLLMVLFLQVKIVLSLENVEGSKVKYDSEILKAFNESELVRVIINLKNMSEAENFLSIFSVNELKLIRKSTMRIGAEITKDGFERLINDSRVEAIYKDIIVQGTNNETDILKENNSYQNNAYISFKDKIKSNTLIIISIVLTLTIIILLIKKSKRK